MKASVERTVRCSADEVLKKLGIDGELLLFGLDPKTCRANIAVGKRELVIKVRVNDAQERRQGKTARPRG